MLQNILLATAPCAECEPADAAAIRLAERGKAILNVLHVRKVMPAEWTQLLKRGDGEYEREVRGLLRSRLERLSKGRIPFRVLLDEGAPHVEILRWAWKTGSSLIVLGSPTSYVVGRQGKRSYPEGSGIDMVGGAARCPVLIVPRQADAGRTLPEAGGAVVAATDFSREADMAVSYAADLASGCGRPLEIVHVAQPSGHGPRIDEETALSAMRACYLDGRPERSAARLLVLRGDPAAELAGLSGEARVGLLVMGHRAAKLEPRQSFESSVMCQTALASLAPIVCVNSRFQKPAVPPGRSTPF